MSKLSILNRQTKTEKLISMFQNVGWLRMLFYSQSVSRSKARSEMADKGEETSCIHKTNFDQRPELAKKQGKKLIIPKLWRLRNWIGLRTGLFKDLKSALSAEPGLGWITEVPPSLDYLIFPCPSLLWRHREVHGTLGLCQISSQGLQLPGWASCCGSAWHTEMSLLGTRMG